jgi:hypothetical protein
LAAQLKSTLKQRLGDGPGVWIDISMQEVGIGRGVDINLVIFKVVVAGVPESRVF